MITAGLVFAALAALLHVYIFTMESLTWTSPRTRKTFGTTAEEAETTKLLALTRASTTCSWRLSVASDHRGCHGTQSCFISRRVESHFRRRRIHGRRRGGAAAVVTGQGAGGVDPGHISLIAIVLLVLGLVA